MLVVLLAFSALDRGLWPIDEFMRIVKIEQWPEHVGQPTTFESATSPGGSDRDKLYADLKSQQDEY